MGARAGDGGRPARRARPTTSRATARARSATATRQRSIAALAAAGVRDAAAEPFDTTLLLGGRGSLDDVMQFLEGGGPTRRLLGDARHPS